MSRKITLINRLGNKTNDIKFFYKYMPLDDVKIIVEPFAGAYAISSRFYNADKKYIFHINDIDEVLYYFYKNSKELIKYRQLINDYGKLLDKQVAGKKVKTFINNMPVNDNMKTYFINSFLIRGSMFKPIKADTIEYNKNDLEILNNERNIITNEDYKEIFKQYENNKDAFLFLDPPYIFSDNSNYSKQNYDADNTDMLIYILEFIKKAKCKILLIINDLKILRYIFKDYVKGDYLKTYQIGKKQNRHLIICNY